MRNYFKKLSTFVFLIFIITILMTGCNNSFVISESIIEKNIIYDKDKFKYYIYDGNTRKDFLIKYHQRSCSIFCIIPNKDKKLLASKISTRKSKSYPTNSAIKNVIMPQRFIVLISGNKVVYNLESPDFTSIQWINNHHLLIIRKHQKLVINENGQVISDKHYRDDQLKLAPKETIY